MDEHCYVEPLHKTVTAEELQTTTAALLAVQGLGCASCASRVRNRLLSLTGVVEAQVLQSLGMAHVTYNPQLTDIPTLVQTVAQAGDDRQHAYRAQLVGGPGVEAY